MVCKPVKKIPLRYEDSASHSKPLQCPATRYFSLVMSRGKRFESARRLSLLRFAGKTQINGTVSVQSRNIYRNLHTFDQTQEVVFAIRGVIDIEEREYRSPSES